MERWLPSAVRSPRVARRHRVRRHLTDAGRDEATAARDLEALHAGRALVVVEAAEGDAKRVGALLDG